MTLCSVRRRETHRDSQRNHHSSDARLKLRVFRSTCNSLSRPCCCRPSCPCCTPACTATALPLSRCLRCHGVSARDSTLKRSSLCSALHTPGTPAHSVSSRCDSRREIVQAPLPCCNCAVLTEPFGLFGVVLGEHRTASRLWTARVLWVLTGTHRCDTPIQAG